ncbi:hypothetical protein Zmor_001282 [Zophobas morio]|uniref:CCHC-type domain-containing protein n=1 Tax=Zophobas morio TaxID=2755281 RepID=A0AA38J223_9CUCU|nr:hypothetical protein Zmor_001282 [Zophobas morio]
MSFVKAAILREKYSHILSFRRQIHVQPNESLNLPASMVCFKCKVPGHFAQDCPGVIAGNGVAAVNTSKTNTETSLNNKRQTTEDAFAEDNPLDFSLKFSGNNHPLLKDRLKKIRPSDPIVSLTSTPGPLLPVKPLIDNQDRQYPLNFTQVVEFMDESIGERDFEFSL